jgi:rhomboid protease GluP
METGSGSWLEVRRGGRKLLSGTGEEVLAAARAGRLRHSDRIVAPGLPEPVPPHAFAELARLVPGPEESATRRMLGVLVGFAAAGGALLLFAAGLAAASGGGQGRLLLGGVILFVALFVAPIFPLRRRVRQLRAMRAQGIVPGANARRTTGHPGLDALLRRRPALAQGVTVGIVAASLAAFVFPDLAIALAKVNDRILAGEWWRLVTVALVHGSLPHLAFNALALWSLGGLAEAFYGRARLAAILAAGTAFATLASVAWTDANAVGASGGVFAVVGAVLAFALRARGLLPEPLRRRLVRDMLWIVGVNVAFGLTVPYVDNAAHLGGLAAGAVLGAALGPDPDLRRLIGARRA